MKFRYGMIHGRFQPFHPGHLTYLRAALERCQRLIIAIANPRNPATIREDAEASDVRALMGSGGDWRSLVSSGVATVIDWIAAGDL